jgi:hypothetical protein
LEKTQAMDVVLTPMGIHGDAWTLKDRLGRSLGTVQKVENPDGFVIAPDGSAVLKSIKLVHPSLDEAMSGACRKRGWACVHRLLAIPAQLAAPPSEPAHDPQHHRRQAEAPIQG